MSRPHQSDAGTGHRRELGPHELRLGSEDSDDGDEPPAGHRRPRQRHQQHGPDAQPAPPPAQRAARLQAPDLVYVPAYPNTAGGNRQLALDLRRSAAGEIVAIAFSSTRSLVEALGRCQPWICVSAEKFRVFIATIGVRDIVLDPWIDPAVQRIDPAQLRQFVAAR